MSQATPSPQTASRDDMREVEFPLAHIGWMFGAPVRADEDRYAKDLRSDPLMRFINRTFVLWVIVGLAIAFGLGVALTQSVADGLTAMLWGGAVRIFLLHHATFSINSLCHVFGRRAFETGDESRNIAWLAIPTAPDRMEQKAL